MFFAVSASLLALTQGEETPNVEITTDLESEHFFQGTPMEERRRWLAYSGYAPYAYGHVYSTYAAYPYTYQESGGSYDSMPAVKDFEAMGKKALKKEVKGLMETLYQVDMTIGMLMEKCPMDDTYGRRRAYFYSAYSAYPYSYGYAGYPYGYAHPYGYGQESESNSGAQKMPKMKKKKMIKQAKKMTKSLAKAEKALMEKIESCGGKKAFMRYKLEAEVEDMTMEVKMMKKTLKGLKKDCDEGYQRRRQYLYNTYNGYYGYAHHGLYGYNPWTYQESEANEEIQNQLKEMSTKKLKKEKKKLMVIKKAKKTAIKNFECK